MGGGLRRGETLAILLSHFAVGFVSTAAGAILPQLQPLGVVPAIFDRGVITLPAVGTLQGDYASRIGIFSCHFLIQ
jgi:hypothetical protein